MAAGRPPLAGPLPALLAWRFLRGDRSRLLDGTARSALLATALGVAAMVIAMALMTGYRGDLERKLVRGNAAVVVYPLGGAGGSLDERALARLSALPGVRKVGRVVYGQGSLASERAPAGREVVLRGVDPGGGQLSARAEQLRRDPDGLPGAVLGRDLAARLGVSPGAILRLVSLGLAQGEPRFRYLSLRVTGTFSTGFAEFDQAWVLLERAVVEELSGASSGAAILAELTLDDPSAARETAAAAETALGPGYLITAWQDLNRELFAALRLQQAALFVVLGLIVLVSTFNVASTLVVLVRERRRDLGALAALGFGPARLRRAFLVFSAVLGAAGTAIGVAVGCAVSFLLTTFRVIRFDPDIAAIYFIDHVPFRVAPRDLLAIVGFALAVTIVASWLPAWRAGRLDPSAALRSE